MSDLSSLGTHLGHYKIIKLLNQGGMGQIYLAEDQRLHRTVAIKTLKPAITSPNATGHAQNDTPNGYDAKVIANALLEAQLLAKLNHANIVQIYDITQENEQICLVMEYLDGKTLHHYQQEHINSLTQKLAIISQISKGLTAAHAQGIVHCDLKPSNIIIDGNGGVKIVDFGIAKLTSGNADTANNSQSFGSQTAMSPEQLYQALPNKNVEPATDKKLNSIDFRSDLFSLGIIAFQFISGRHPFAGDTATHTAQNILNDQGQSAQDIVPQLPQELISLLNNLLSHQVENRPQSSQWVSQQFEQITKHLTQQEILAEDTLPLTAEFSTELSASLTGSLKPVVTVNNRRKGIIAITLAVLVILLIVAGVFNEQLFAEKTLPTRYVVVLPPTLTQSSKIADMQKDLVSATIDDAIRQSIINTKQLQLISHKEVKTVNKTAKGDLATIAAATGATDIITTELDCNNVRCNVTLSRLTVKSDSTNEGLNVEDDNFEGNNKALLAKKWTVLSQKKWPTQLVHYNDINQDAKANVVQLYPAYRENYFTDKPVNPKDYLSYVELYKKTLIQGQSTSANLEKLHTVINNSPYLYSAYTLYRELALNLYHQTNDKKYIERFEKVMASAPPEYKYSVFQAIDAFGVLLSLNDIEQAKKQLTVVIERGIDHSTLLELKAFLFYISADYQQATDFYISALALRPSTKLLYNLAICYYYLNDFNNTKNTLEKVIAITPKKYTANQLLAATYLMTGQFKLAIDRYEEMLLLTKDKSLILTNLGLAYSLAGRYSDALPILELSVKNSPNHSITLLNLADVKLIIGESEQANLLYKKVIQLNSNDSGLFAQRRLAQAHVHLGNHNAAIKAVNNAKKIAPNDGETAFIAALIYSEIGETISAINQVEEALVAGIGAAWFNLPWFDKLCESSAFKDIMNKAGKGERCQPH